MTSPSDTPRALLAERFGEDLVPLDTPDQPAPAVGQRARFIASLHSLIAWLIAHPEVPTPWSCSVGIRTASHDELEELAAAFGRSVFKDCHFSMHDEVSSEFYMPISITFDPNADRPL